MVVLKGKKVQIVLSIQAYSTHKDIPDFENVWSMDSKVIAKKVTHFMY